MNLVISMYSSKYQEDNNNFEYFRGVTWSPFERIEVKPVKSFKDLCKGGTAQNESAESKYVWVGVKQCLHLIGIDNDKGFSLKDDNNGDYIFNTPDNKSNYDFYCVLTMRFNPIVHKIYKSGYLSEDEGLISGVRNETVKIVKNDLPDDVACTFFRSLGSEDMVIVFLSNSMKDIMNIVDTTRNIQFKYNDKVIDLFSTVYMFTGLNNPKCDKEIGTDLIVNLHLREHNITNIEDELKRKGLDNVSYKVIFRGKGTMQLEIPGSVKASALFDDNEGILNEHAVFFNHNFYSCRVYIKEEPDIYQNTKSPKSIDKYAGWLGDKENGESNCCEDEKITQMTDVAKFIFGEYKRMIANDRFCQWKNILDKHYKATLNFVGFYMHHDRLTECKLLENMQSSLHLINQACSPASDIPYHNYYYSGSFNDLLRAYYGIINMLFNIIYGLPHSEGTRQHEITFAIRLEAIARIQSEMYTMKGKTERIIVFALPYDSFWNYTKNIQLLIHEAFHYAAPYDRIQRNNDVLDIIFKILLNRYFRYVSEKYKEEYLSDPIVIESLKNWRKYMLHAFDQDDEIKNKLANAVHQKYKLFFTNPAPEWNVIFCKNKNLDRIIRMTADYVQKFISEHAEKAWQNIAKDYNVCKDIDISGKLNFNELDYAEYNKIITTISTLNTSVKEAFCDIWAIKITKVSIHEYILWLFKVMLEINGEQSVYSALAFNFPNHNIRMYSVPIRLYLLLYYDFIEKGDQDFNPASALVHCLSGTDNDKVHKCVEVFINYLSENEEMLSVFQVELYNMAFRKLSDYFSEDQFKKNPEVISLHSIYERDLTNENADLCTYLDKCIYYNIVKRPKNKYYTSDKIAVTNKYGLAKYDYCGESNSLYLISSIPEYMKCLNDIYRMNEKSLEKHKLWYRGICNINFSLLPSLFRNCDDSISLYANQANIMKKAYFNSTASTELWDQTIQKKMASLQHYGVPTNLLDFSLDQFVALYFAVYPDRIKDQEDIDKGIFRPVVYAFNPVAYSKAIECLKSGNPHKTQIYNLSPVIFDFNQNPEECEKYFVGDVSYNYLVEHTIHYNTTDYMPNPCVDLYPVPMVIERTNARIKAQSGVFVAYPLNAQPECNLSGESRYFYMDLQQIQSKYNQLVGNLRLDGPFLFAIEIRKDCVQAIRNELKQFNIDSGRYYPELSKLFENIKN